MDKNKLALPITILLSSIILGSFYYVSEINKQKSIEKQQTEQEKQVRTVKEFKDNTIKITNLYNQVLPNLPAHDLYCIPSKKSSCTLEGCKEIEANVFVLLGINSKENNLFMARCDNKPCDVYSVNLVQSGMFTTFETKEPHGILFRTSQLDQSYIEVVTFGTDSLVSNGYCYKK